MSIPSPTQKPPLEAAVLRPAYICADAPRKPRDAMSMPLSYHVVELDLIKVGEHPRL